jgi:hypothetical protein
LTSTFSGFTSRCTIPARSGEHRVHHLDRLARGEPAAPAEHLAQGAAGDVLHRQVGERALVAGSGGAGQPDRGLVVDAHDVRVAQPRGRLRLADEPGHVLGPPGQAGVDDLQRDRPVEPVVEGTVDRGHPAVGQAGLDPVPAVDDLPGFEVLGRQIDGGGAHGPRV